MRAATGKARRARPQDAATGDLFGPPAAPTRTARPAGTAIATPAVATPAAAASAAMARSPPRQLWLALFFPDWPAEAALPTGAHRLESLARWATGYTPCVSPAAPDRLLLEIRASLRLFGGAAALMARVAAELAARGEQVAMAVAPTPRAAEWLVRTAAGARAGSAGPWPCVESPALLAGALAGLPLACTGWPARTLENLSRLGVRTLGELRRLPREGLAHRCEPFVLAEFDEALGTRPAPRRRYVAPERFEERIELEAGTGSCALLAPSCERLLARLAHFLRARGAGVTRLAFSFRHRGRPPTIVLLGRALPGGEAREWGLLLKERLARTTLPAPAVAVGLRSTVAVPLPAASGALPGVEVGAACADAWTLLDRLRARLGAAAVSGVCLVPEHRPERAFRCVSPQPATRADPAPPSLPCAPRPLWLLAAPQRLVVRHGQPCQDGPLRIESGPERIESGWWDGSDVARDYYVAATRAGVRLWIYRERGAAGAAGAATPGGRYWFLHGVFG